MPGLEEHRQHLAPQRCGRHRAVQLHLAASGPGLGVAIAGGEGLAVDLVQVGHFVGREQRPRPVGLDPLHEQVGNPHRRVHVVGAAALVAGVAAQLEEVLDVVVPRLEVGAGRAAALAAAVDRHRHVVGDLEERHHALALDARAGDARAGAADVRPVVAEPARPLRQLGVVAERLEDVAEVVLDGRQVARRQLRPRRAGVEQRRRRRHVAQRRHQVVEGERLSGRVVLVDGQAHGDAHPEGLGQLHRPAAVARQVAIGQGLHAEILEQRVPFGPERRRQRRVVEGGQAAVVEAAADAASQATGERLPVARVAIAVAGRAPGHFAEQRVELEPRRRDAVGRIALDEGRRGEHQRPLDLGRGDAVEDRAQRLADERVDRDVGGEIADPCGDRGAEPRRVERHRRAVARADGQAAEAGPLEGGGPLRIALPLAVGTVEDVGLGDLVEALADERLLDQVLDVLDGRRRFAEARLRVGDDAVDDAVDDDGGPTRLDGRPDGPDRLDDGRVDPAAVEGSGLPGAFDDAQNGHGRTPGRTWISQRMGSPRRRSTTSCGRLRSRS